MIRLITLIIIFLFIKIIDLKAFENQYAGARPLALSGAYVAFNDIWSSFYNQAGIAGFREISAGVFYESRFQLKELSLMAGAVIIPAGTANFGFNYLQFGTGAFKETKLGLLFSKQLSKKLSAGLQFDYLAVVLPENQRAKGLATFEAGVVYRLSKKLQLGAHIFNPVNRGIKTFHTFLNIPVIFRIGGRYNFSNLVLTCFEIEEGYGKVPVFKAGTEFLPAKNLAVRFGISGKPFSYTAGFGYTFGNIKTGFAFNYHGVLGISPSVSIQFAFND